MDTGDVGDGNDVVITGMAGLYPKARHIKDLEHILYNKINPISSEDIRWKYDHPEVAKYMGNVMELDRFDAQFFKVNHRLAYNMDCLSRKLLELTFEAIYDSGMSPKNLDGERIGVFIASCFSETENGLFYSDGGRNGLALSGCSRAKFANRISYWLNVRGPSFALDQATCGSAAALTAAYNAIYRGECEGAIVGSGFSSLHPQSSVNCSRVINMSNDGKTRSFSEDAAGCAFSEAINILFLQKAKDAKRIYATLVYAKSDYVSMSGETGPKFSFYRAPPDTVNFLRTFYNEAGVQPSAVEYVEAFGSADPEADKSELEAVEEVFCTGKEGAVLVGSVLSNLGYGEAASGLTSVIKVLLGYHKGLLAGNLHCSVPRKDIKAIQDGRLQVLTDHHPFKRTYAAVNNLSYSGVNAHILLKGYYKPKNKDQYTINIPRLITMSARHEKAVERAFKILESDPIDPEQIALLHNIHEKDIAEHLWKGFILLDTNPVGATKSIAQEVQYCNGAQRPLWFVYSGVGSQWAGMGAQLMRIPIFAASIQRCNKVLKPRGINIVNILTSPDKTTFDNILNSFVGIAAVQIGLTDMLNELGIVPDKIIGHSVGELGCAYADGCLTAEEMILSAYYRGRVSLETPLIQGAMAAIGMGAQQMSAIIPPEIEIACHNSVNFCTISGPAKKLRTFVADLKARGIFAKEVPCADIAYHSRYIADAGPGLLKYLKEVIKEPKLRSQRWVSTSVPQDKWNEPTAQYCSAEYQTNNLLNPVLFEEACALIPLNAVTIEIAPHSLLNAILKRSLPKSVTNIPLTFRRSTNNVATLLQALGQLYILGFNPKVRALYPEVKFPVSTGTPFLSHFVEWFHEDQWPMPLYPSAPETTTACCTFITTCHGDNEFLRGHVLQNKILVPTSYILVAVWDTLAMSLYLPKKSFSVEFSDVEMYAQPLLLEQKAVRLSVYLQKGSGYFEVVEGNSKVAAGTILYDTKYPIISDNINTGGSNMELTALDVYRIFDVRGYSYSGVFRSIHCVDASVSNANVLWKNDWITFIDGLLQLNTLKCTSSCLVKVARIGKLVIDVTKHFEGIKIQTTDSNCITFIETQLSELHKQTTTNGLLIKEIHYCDVIQLNNTQVTLQPLQFDEKARVNIEKETYTEYGLLLKSATINDDVLVLESEVLGDLNSLNWVLAHSLPEDGNLDVVVHYAGINTEDTRHALGLNNHNNNKFSYGLDFSGVTDRGERVMGIYLNGTTRTKIRVHSELAWPVPDHWTLEDAATVPLAYLYAYYCISLKMNNQTRSQSPVKVLIHGGTGALGQAVISIALARGWRVFSTVRDINKKRFLLRLFPQLNANDIGCSRDVTFRDMVLSATNGKGCDVVICCLKSELKSWSHDCSGVYGVLLDTVQNPHNENYKFGMSHLNKERSYVAVDIKKVLSNIKSKEVKTLHSLLSEGIVSGEVNPLTRVTFAPNESTRAFRLLEAGHHRGRVLIRVEDILTPVRLTSVSYAPEDPCHVIVCGSSQIGFKIIDKLKEYGINKFCVHIDGPHTALHAYYKCLWKRQNIDVVLSHGTLRNIEDVMEILQSSIELGSTKGIHIVTEEISNKIVGDMIDTASRKLCPHLKYFVVVGTDMDVGRNTCMQRANMGLPATFLNISMLHSTQNDYDNVLYDGIANAAKQAWRNSSTMLLALPKPSSERSLLKHIADSAGICINSEIHNFASLKELGVTSERYSSISAFMTDVFNTCLDEKDISLLTIEKLKHIEDMNKDPQFEDVKGLAAFFSSVERDELLGSIDMVALRSETKNYSIRKEEYDPSETYLCIVPGLEGLHGRFSALCEGLKLGAFVLQPGFDHFDKTPREMAVRYFKILSKNLNFKKKFYILGYETGVAVALELANILEKQGLTGTIFALGEGPLEMQTLLELNLTKYSSESALQEALVLHFFKLFKFACNVTETENIDTYQIDCEEAMIGELEIALRSCSTWEGRVDACVGLLVGRVAHSAQYMRAQLKVAYSRLEMASRTPPPACVLRSQIVLMRARTQLGTVDHTHSLQRYSTQNLHVVNLDTPLAYVMRDLRVPAIINSFLDSNILQAYENKNLCDEYYLSTHISLEMKNI